MNNDMQIEFWGVRGSIPSPGPQTARYGGNTACVSITFGEDKVLILDAGTGIRNLGKKLKDGRQEIIILLSHHHWDHIQGFPFFIPIYEAGREIIIFTTKEEKDMICSIIDQMDGAHFPVKSQSLPAHYKCLSDNMMNKLGLFGFKVSRINTNHAGDGFGYRIANNGHSVVYLTDNELDPPYRTNITFEAFVKFCKDADILIHDAQYIEEDFPEKHGWGHSLISQACKLAAASTVKHLVLTHHDPDRTDVDLDVIQKKCREWFRRNNYNIMCTVAYEGLKINI